MKNIMKNDMEKITVENIASADKELLKKNLLVWLKADIGNNGRIWSEFHDKLRETYPNYEDYEMYHFGTSTPNRELTEVDFPNGDSVQKFIEDRHRELQETQE